MKKIALALAMVAMTGSAYAANSLNAGTVGLTVPVISGAAVTNNNVANPLIAGKYMVGKDLAVLGGFGFVSGGPSGASVTTFSLMGGVRKYMKVDDFAPFAGAFLQYETTSTPTATTALTIAAEAGAEYFIGKQFSVEGKVNFGYVSMDGAAKTSYFGTSTATAGLNFYF